ncbi:MAG: sulfatase, partial [Planctomycetaceae bacterium]
MSYRSIAVLAGACAVIAAGVWWWAARTPRWNVVLITLDTTRADHLGCYGRTAAATPNLDWLASQGVLFEHAYTVVPITLPAHATLLTGLLPPEHGLRINGTSRLPDSIPTLAETLQRAGYRTGAFVSSLVLDARFGLARGFEHYDDRLGIGPNGPHVERPASNSVSEAIAWLDTVASESFLCWVHLYDPHEPYDEHRRDFDDQFAGRPYDAEIAYMDRHIGRLLDFLQRLDVDDRTLIVIAGDHGEGLGEHAEPTHGYLAYNSTLHVPLIVRRPDGEQSGARVAEPVSLADVFPTILDSLEREVPSGLFGRSLLPYWQDIVPAPRPCYGETEAPLMEAGWCPLRTWTTARWKYIHSTQP